MNIVTSKGQRLRVERPDRVELARAVEAEGEPRDLVAQALVNRWAHLRDAGAVMPLGELVRAYSQALSPRWWPTGDRHLAEMRAAPDDATRADLERRAVRRQQVHAVRELFQPATLRATQKALSGPLSIDPRIVHFAIDTPERRARFPLIELHNGVGFYGAERGEAQRYSLPPGGPTMAAAAVLDDGKASTAIAFFVGLLGLSAVYAAKRKGWHRGL